MSLRSSLSVSRKVSCHCGKLMRLPTQHISRGLRLIAPPLIAMSLAGIAHAQGTMDFSGHKRLWGRSIWVRLPFKRRSYSRIPPRSYPKSRCAPSIVNEKISAIASSMLSVGWFPMRLRLERRCFVTSSRRSKAWRSRSFDGLNWRCSSRRCATASEISLRGTGRYTAKGFSQKNSVSEL